jgi:hypothetical protein
MNIHEYYDKCRERLWDATRDSGPGMRSQGGQGSQQGSQQVPAGQGCISADRLDLSAPASGILI